LSLLEISVIPVGVDSLGFDSIVKDAVFLVEEKGVDYQITPTKLIIEGELEQLMQTAGEIHRQTMASGVKRAITNIVIDDRTDGISLDQQVKSVTESLDLNKAILQY